MRPRRLFPFALALLCASALALGGCASKQKKPRRTVLMTSADDARVGRMAAADVKAQMGVLDDLDLNTYVSELGRKLLRGIPRRSFHYNFWVVDQYEPNAFALPGGYIFISRGLLALANNEDELACVIGHEITHAALRHSATQQALARRSNPLSMPWVRAANLAAYGRDMEREADRGGQMLCAAAGYDPMGMSTFLNNLGQRERLLIGHSRIPTFMDTHPGADERAAANAVRARELRWTRDPALGDTTVAHLKRIDGLVLGERPEAGVFRGNRFIHPDLDFQLLFPHGWRTSNTNAAVGAVEPRGEAAVFLKADQPEGDPRQVAENFVAKLQEEMKVKVIKSLPVKIGHIDSWRIHLEARGRGGSLGAIVTFIPFGGVTWSVTGVSPARYSDRFLGRTLNTARSFRPLSEEMRHSLTATRVRLITAFPGEDLRAIDRRTDNAWDPANTAISNGIFVNHRFHGGELVKIASVEAYIPKADPDSQP